MKNKNILCVLACASLASPTVLQAASKPNIIFILADDLGWGDPAFRGHPYMKTPNLDRLASQGTVFNQFYVANPVCSPSRTGFMTGHYPARHNVDGHFATHKQNAARNMPDWLDPKVTTVVQLLKNAGMQQLTLGNGIWATDQTRQHPTNMASTFPRQSTPVTRRHSLGMRPPSRSFGPVPPN